MIFSMFILEGTQLHFPRKQRALAGRLRINGPRAPEQAFHEVPHGNRLAQRQNPPRNIGISRGFFEGDVCQGDVLGIPKRNRYILVLCSLQYMVLMIHKSCL